MNSANNKSKQKLEINTISVTQKEELTESQNERLNTDINTAQKKKKSPWYFLGLAMLAIGSIAGWRTFTVSQKPSSIEQRSVSAPASLPVRTVRSQINPIEAWVFSNGEVAAVRFKHLTFQTAGTINYLKQIEGQDLREGDFVKAGELLARIDQRKLNADITVAAASQAEARKEITNALANLQQAKAGLEAERANLSQAEQNLAKAKADLSKAKTSRNFAETDLIRYQELVAEGAIQRREVELKKTNFLDAEANLEAANAGVKSAESQIRATQAQIAAAQGQLLAAQTQVETAESGLKSASARLDKSNVILEDTVLTAPFDGVVAYLNIREGDYWSPEVLRTSNYQEVVESVPMMVVDPNKLEVNLELPAFDGSKVRPNQTAYIVRDADLTQASIKGLSSENLIDLAQAKGDIFAVNPAVTPGGRAVNARIRIAEGKENLKVGERVSVWIATDSNPKAVVVPKGSLVIRDRQAYAFVVNEGDNTVEQRPVELGIEGLAYQEIKAGVAEGELVVTDGKNRLVNGSSVRLVGSNN
ncbi:RND transporter MFP subunit [Hyella patelloides LEGE 07179]|uniref:RND transporter MFP subunit n=1 Tax=Hyella patelloides LEGE 07179 TaxID=945734 RepID=A0A563VSB4_9CYAN|nr:efflux RND transporter periplasmic adaptor subunit [Hyella patelloides]VEP14315.1 RND transporter MFP subunit [Hyella patelloides LEGE 07179]VEP14418.1 RND transporter MFP subunit [Hyella patelloides LEGE 07179]